MQTFLPLVTTGHKPSLFVRTADCLDDKRLNKQILEASQILNILEHRVVRGSYVNHPAVTMWRGYPTCLKVYFNTMLYEWVHNRHKNHSFMPYKVGPHDVPPWMGHGNIEVHLSHRAMLYHKDPEHYKSCHVEAQDYVDYVWPSDRYQTYYKVLYDFEFMFGEPEDATYFPDTYFTRAEAIAACQNHLLQSYGHYYIDGNSRFALDTPVQLEPLFVRLQPVRFINYQQPL